MNKHITTAALIAALTGTLTACSDDTPDTTTTTTATSSPARPTSVRPTLEAPTAAPTGPIDLDLDDTARWDGITLEFSSFKRGRTTSIGVPEDKPYIRANAVLTNKTDTPLAVSTIALYCTTQEVYDSSKGLEGRPRVHVMPGRSLTFSIACAHDTKDTYLQLEANPTFDGARTAIFTGKIE